MTITSTYKGTTVCVSCDEIAEYPGMCADLYDLFYDLGIAVGKWVRKTGADIDSCDPNEWDEAENNLRFSFDFNEQD